MNFPEDFIDKIVCGDALELLKQMDAGSVILPKEFIK